MELVFNHVERLIEYPESGRIVPEINKLNIRELVHGNYRVIYKIGLDEVHILTVRHYKQILPIDEVNLKVE
ncbi:type II toxin-antitoxin system RelE/ParE family toxin [bacterium]|nr:type II toxin-antitoxin system RelE/ParE family toxin [bacterium]